MLDRSRLRDESEEISALLKTRGYQLEIAIFNQLDTRHKSYQQQVQDLLTERKAHAKKFEELIQQGKSADEARTILNTKTGKSDKQDKALSHARQMLKEADEQLQAFMLEIPNIPDAKVVPGKSEADNKVLALSQLKPTQFNFKPKDHVALSGADLDTELAASLVGARFMVLRGNLARLHRVLGEFMLDYQSKAGYEEVYVPYIANSSALRGTGQLPKFEEDLFKLENTDWYLIPTAEVPLTNLYAKRILDYGELEQPIKLVARTPCFRSEAGNYGRDTRGVLRQHQFEKVELVLIVQPLYAQDAFVSLGAQVSGILTALELPFREVALCSGDLGFSSQYTIDYEVWLPSQNKYREISSCSNFGDFQARRMNLRWRDKSSAKNVFPHTLNASGVAIGRCMAALLENHQQADGTVKIPKALMPYLNNEDVLTLKH